MSALSLFKPATEVEGLQSILVELSRYGKPTLGIYGTGGTWHCAVEMNATTTGAHFKVASDFKQETPLAAALQCRERMRQAIAAVRGGTV